MSTLSTESTDRSADEPGARRRPEGAPSLWRRLRRGLGWIIVLVLALAAALTLAPDALSSFSPSLELSARYPVAQIIAMRSFLTLMLAVLALILLIMAAVRALRREGGRRTAVLALVLLVVVGLHAWTLYSRGIETSQRVTGAVRSDPASWDGTVTVLSLNTQDEGADRVALAVAVRDAGADVVVLPEATAVYGQALADLLSEDGFRFTVFSDEDPAGADGTDGAAGADGAAGGGTATPGSNAAAGTASSAATSAAGVPTSSSGSAASPSANGTATASPSATPSATPTASEDASSAVSTTTVLVSAALGDYEQTDVGADLGLGAVELTPVGEPRLNGHQRPTILGVHTVAPLPASMEQWRASVRAVADQCAAAAMSPGLVIAGDLNASLDNAPLSELGGCADAGVQARVGGLSTWPTVARTPLLGSTIDHVLIDDATWSTTAGQVLDIDGTDHRGVAVSLRQS